MYILLILLSKINLLYFMGMCVYTPCVCLMLAEPEESVGAFDT